MPAAGYRNNNNGTLNNAGTNGNYWSSTQNDSNNAYNLNFNSNNANTNNNNRNNGFSVRCVQNLTGNMQTFQVFKKRTWNVFYISIFYKQKNREIYVCP